MGAGAVSHPRAESVNKAMMDGPVRSMAYLLLDPRPPKQLALTHQTHTFSAATLAKA